MAQKLKRIGIFGGSFDPPHLGHLVIAEMARRSLDLNAVYFVPAYKPPHKEGSHASTARDRLTMTKLSVQGNAKLKVSDVELRRKGISYTVDTVRAFRKRFPTSQLFLIIGSDSLLQFHSWKSPGRILADASLVVYRRPRSGRADARLVPSNVSFIEGPRMDVSSSDIRKRIQQGKSIRYLVRDSVLRLINRKKLYTDPA
jgi:nicotinate-nucleotide adenylyltransferase